MNIQGYIPSRREINLIPPERSFEELAWGPSLMMAREKETGNTIADINKGLDFEYFDVDDPKVKPELDALQAEGDSLATELATKGYNPLLNQKILNYRQKYQRAIGPHGTLGRASKNYTDAMNQWAEWSKAHEKDPQFYREKVKDKIFGNYRGMWDEDTKSYRGFEAGEVPNYYNLGDDLRDEIAKAKGKIGQIYGSDNATISVRNVGGYPVFEVTNRNTGQKITNSDALVGGLNALREDYFSPNKNTDRSRFAELMGVTPEQFGSMATNVATSLRDDYFQSMPGSSTSYQNVPQERTGSRTSESQDQDFLQYGTLDTKVENVENKYAKWRKLLDKSGKMQDLDVEKAPTGVADINSVGGVSGLSPGFTSIQPDKVPLSKDWDKLKTKFSNLYDLTKGNGTVVGGKLYKGDSGFLDLAEQADASLEAIRGTELGINSLDFNKSLWRAINENKDTPAFIKVGSPNKTLTKKEVEDKKELKREDLLYRVDSDGNLTVNIGGDDYNVNKKALSRQVKSFDDNVSEITNVNNNFGLTSEQISNINNKTYTVGKAAYKWRINPENPMQRQLFRIYKDETGQLVADPTTLSNVQAEVTKQKYVSQKPLEY